MSEPSALVRLPPLDPPLPPLLESSGVPREISGSSISLLCCAGGPRRGHRRGYEGEPLLYLQKSGYSGRPNCCAIDVTVPLAARAVHFLDYQLVEAVEHVGEVVGLAAAPGRHVFENRFLAEIEPHDLRHVAVDRLVVGDAGADRVR